MRQPARAGGNRSRDYVQLGRIDARNLVAEPISSSQLISGGVATASLWCVLHLAVALLLVEEGEVRYGGGLLGTGLGRWAHITCLRVLEVSTGER